MPERCLIYAGAYVPKRKEWVKSLFDRWQRIRGYWVRYSFASKNGREYLLVFNVYGAAVTLEVIRLLKDGGVKRVFFIGSLGGKELPVGTLVLPTKIVDKTGFVAADSQNKQIVEPKEDSLKKSRRVLEDLGQAYVEGTIVSVPCVLHTKIIGERRGNRNSQCHLQEENERRPPTLAPHPLEKTAGISQQVQQPP